MLHWKRQEATVEEVVGGVQRDVLGDIKLRLERRDCAIHGVVQEASFQASSEGCVTIGGQST